MTSFREFREREGGIDPASLVQMTLPPSARSFQGQRAGFPTRALACFIDLLIVIGAMFLLWFGLWLLSLVFDPGVDTSTPGAGALVLVGYGFMWAYWTLAWATTGRSIGAWIMGIRVVNFRGSRMSWPGAALRSAFCVGFPFGLLWVIISRRNRSVQDLVLRTNVIYDWVLDIRT